MAYKLEIMKIYHLAAITLLVAGLLLGPVYGQEGLEYIKLINDKKYSEALGLIDKNLAEIYSSRVSGKRIPSGYISLKNIGAETDLLSLFRKRKEKGFFIENNTELKELHFYAGICSSRLKKNRDSLNHFIQSLRFSLIQEKETDRVYYEISRIFKSLDKPEFSRAYTDALEQAYTLNMNKYDYSLELGQALSGTVHRKKSIFHLKRYVENTEKKVAPEIYLNLAGLNESIGNYLEAEKYYREYTGIKPDNGEILFALGHIAYSRTGNYSLARSSFLRALRLLPEKDIYRRSKCYEYMGDMSLSNLKYKRAEALYLQTIEYQKTVLSRTEDEEKKFREMSREIDALKAELINKKNFDRYEEYEILLEERGEVAAVIDRLKLEFRKLNPGKVRWNLGVALMKQDKPEEAIRYFRGAIKYQYNANPAREMIIKLQLKIKRGY